MRLSPPLAWPMATFALLVAGCGAPNATNVPAQELANRCRLLAAPAVLSDLSLTANSPHAATAGGRVGVVWEELEPTHAGAHFALVDRDAVSHGVVELGIDEHARTRNVHVGGRADGGFLTSWHESPKGGAATAYLREVTADGRLPSAPLEIGDVTGDLAAVAGVGRRAAVVRTSTTLAGSQIGWALYDQTSSPAGTRPGVVAAPVASGTLSDRASAFTTIDSHGDGERLAVAWAEPLSSSQPTRAATEQPASGPSLLTRGTIATLAMNGPLPLAHVALGSDTSVTLRGEREGVAYTDPSGELEAAFGSLGAFGQPIALAPGRGPDTDFLGADLIVCATDDELATHLWCYLVGAGRIQSSLEIEEGAQDIDEIDVAAVGQRAIVVWQQAGGPGTEVMRAALECAPASAPVSRSSSSAARGS